MEYKDKTFGQILKECRIQKQLEINAGKKTDTLRKMGDDLGLGLTITNWYSWEKEKTFPKLEIVKTLCDYFGLSYFTMSKKWVEAKVHTTSLTLERKREKTLELFSEKHNNN